MYFSAASLQITYFYISSPVEWLLCAHAEPSGFLLHSMECAFHPPGAVW